MKLRYLYNLEENNGEKKSLHSLFIVKKQKKYKNTGLETEQKSKSLNIKSRHKWDKMSKTSLEDNLSFSYNIKIPFVIHPFSY